MQHIWRYSEASVHLNEEPPVLSIESHIWSENKTKNDGKNKFHDRLLLYEKGQRIILFFGCFVVQFLDLNVSNIILKLPYNNFLRCVAIKIHQQCRLPKFAVLGRFFKPHAHAEFCRQIYVGSQCSDVIIYYILYRLTFLFSV